MKFRFSGNLLRYVDFHQEVEVEGVTVADGLRNVIEIYPEFGPVILDGNGEIRLLHRFCLNGVFLSLPELEEPVRLDDIVAVVSPITGG